MRLSGFCFLIVTCGMMPGSLLAQPAPANKVNADADANKLKRVTWKVGDVTREAMVYAPVPATKHAKRPVIFAFHGHGGRSENAVRKFAFHQHWPEAVCIYPQGLPTPVPLLDPNGKFSGWQKFIGDQDDRDLAFFDAMLNTLTADYQIDEKRIYVAGHSNGAFFTYTLCAARGDKLAAVAPVAGAVSSRDFKNQKPIPVLHVAGEADRIVRFATQARSLEQLRKLYGCEVEGKPAGKWCTEYRSKTGPSVVTFIHPGGHEIPDDAPSRIVQFFQDHPTPLAK